MPEYGLRTSVGLRPLGKFADIEEVKKLRIFKDNPSWLSKVEIVTVTKPAKKYNRWRILLSPGSPSYTDYYYDMAAWYTKEEALKEAQEWAGFTKLRLIPKREYHMNDGIVEVENII